MLPNKEDFLIAEFDALRREIELEIGELGELLRYAVLSSGGLWGWLLSRPHSRLLCVACFLPSALAALFFGESLLVRQHIWRIGDYLARIERQFSLPEELGWELQLFRGLRRREYLPVWENSAWLLLCIGNLVGGVLFAVFS